MEKNLSRRAFLRAAVAAPTIVSSIVARVQPAQCAAAAEAIAALPGCDVTWRAPDDTKLVLVLESDSESALLSQMRQISDTAGVVSADLSYCYNEEDEEDEEEESKESRHG